MRERGARAGIAVDRQTAVEDVLGVDAVQTFKPAPAVYEYALTSLGLPAVSVAMLATHPWDLFAAGSSGMRTAWVRHGVRVWPSVFPAPDVAGNTLAEGCAALVALAG